MISKMVRYDIVLYAGEQECFMNKLRELGLVDITTTGWEPSEADRQLLADIDAHNKSLEVLRSFAGGEGYKSDAVAWSRSL